MRYEIIIPDSTEPVVKARIDWLTRQLSNNPGLVEAIQFESSALNEEMDHTSIQALFTPELLAQIDAAGAEMKAGEFVTQDQIDASLAETRARWIAKNQF